MKKRLCTILCLCGLLLGIDQARSQGTDYQVMGTGDDEFCATTIVLNNTYYTVGNTTSNTAGNNRILLCKFTNGQLQWSKHIYDSLNPSVQYYATDIQAGYSVLTPSQDTSKPGDPDPDFPPPGVNPITAQNSHSYMYISGYTKQNAGAASRILLLRINANGNVLWTRTNFNGNVANIDEKGISVESAPNGDAFIVGQSRNTSTNVAYVSVGRVNNTGTLLWFNRYTNTKAALAIGNFVPRQSCIFEEMVLTSPSAIAITGQFSFRTGNLRPRTFVMRINHGGIENWRMICPSGAFQAPDSLEDSGWDIITDPNTTGNIAQSNVQNYVITGNVGPVASTAITPCRMYVARVSILGMFTNGFSVTAAQPNEAMFGQSIIHATLNMGTDVVIAGSRELRFMAPTRETFMMRVNPGNGGISWSRFYPTTEPNNPATESVIEGAGGYVIATNSFNTNKDAMVIETNNTGQVNSNCPDNTLYCSSASAGSGAYLGYQRYKDTNVLAVDIIPDILETERDSCFPPDPPPPVSCECLPPPQYSVCCCRDGDSLRYNVCFRFDTTGCWNMRNWKITVWYGDTIPATTAHSTTFCARYRRPGTYVMCYEIYGEVLTSWGAWIPCRSITKCMVVNILPCLISPAVPECTPVINCGPIMKQSLDNHMPVADQFDLKLYPNPQSDAQPAILAFTLPARSKVEVELMDISGRVIWKNVSGYEAGAQQVQLPTQNLSNGVYLVRFGQESNTQLLKLDIRR